MDKRIRKPAAERQPVFLGELRANSVSRTAANYNCSEVSKKEASTTCLTFLSQPRSMIPPGDRHRESSNYRDGETAI